SLVVLSSARPRRMVGRESPVAAETSEIPPRPRARASQAAQRRCAFSWSRGARASYFCRTLVIAAGVAMTALSTDYALWKRNFGTTPYAILIPIETLKPQRWW